VTHESVSTEQRPRTLVIEAHPSGLVALKTLREHAGGSLANLGQHYDIDPQTVSRELKKIGVKIRPSGRCSER
jgi:hypothetical protein